AELAAFHRRLSKDTSADEIVSRGEYFTARLMAAFLGYAFVDAADCVFFGLDGGLDRETTDAAIAEALERHGRIVIPGFYGQLPTGRLRVMSRGGSDITGSIAAAAVNADIYENWTDVSGILMADPRIVDNPAPIEKITFAELRELAYMGASVLHEESVQPVKDRGIPLNIRNTNRPLDPGTMIVESVSEDEQTERFITGIAGRKNFTIVTVYKHAMKLSHSLRQALEIYDRFDVPVEHITLGLDSFALVSPTAVLGDAVYDIIAEIKKNCRPDEVDIRENIAMVSAVGRKMSSQPGVSGRLFRALGDEGINIRTIAQGSDELAITVGIENEQYEKAIRVLYSSFAG
ncbi:MAG: aspartate kinase, partial [Oscillospiraceae bacterium]|nr:aspartate kinase [Oscillospiraceae bacterium]